MEGVNITRLTFAPESVNPQYDCPLFHSIPGEVRNYIFQLALSDFEDKENIYKDETCYKRPEYLAPRKTDTALLRTCKLVYSEAWFRPWASTEQSFYLTWAMRRPPRVSTIFQVQKTLKQLHAMGVDTRIQHVRVFAQL